MSDLSPRGAGYDFYSFVAKTGEPVTVTLEGEPLSNPDSAVCRLYGEGIDVERPAAIEADGLTARFEPDDFSGPGVYRAEFVVTDLDEDMVIVPESGALHILMLAGLPVAGSGPGPGPGPGPEPPTEGVWVVSPVGTTGGTGTALSPWSLTYAFQGAGGQLKPGETVLLRGGTYNHQVEADGDLIVFAAPGSPITFRSYPGEWAVINANLAGRSALRIFGSDITVRDIEFVNTDPDRTGGQQGRSDLLYLKGERTNVINCVLHDGGNGIGFWRESINSQVYGCLSYNHGMWEAENPNVTWGHSLYCQNLDNSTKIIKHNVNLFPFRNGLDIRSETTAGGNGFIVDENVFAYPGGGFKNPDEEPAIGIGGTFAPGSKADNFTLRRNIFFVPDARHSNWRFNSGDLAHGHCESVENYFIGGGPITVFGLWDTAHMEENRFYGEYYLVQEEFGTTPNWVAYDWDNNHYFYTGPAGGGQPVFWVNGALTDFAGWQLATGLDANSTYAQGIPGELRVHKYPNMYERGRGWFYVINDGPSTQVNLFLDGMGLEAGEEYEIIDAQNWPGGAIATGTYTAGATHVVPLTSMACPKTIGYDHQPKRDTRLNVFLLRRPLSEQATTRGRRRR